MATPDGSGLSSPNRTRPALLVSVHDVSPLTLEASRRAVDLAVSSGVPVSALTILVIPRHEDRAPLDEHPGACAWLTGLAGAGAELVMHGYTHRMDGRSLSPRGLFWAHGFARGQAELFACDAGETMARLERGRAILERAGLAGVGRSFVPPAWLLSREAREVVRAAGFDFHEALAGIVKGHDLHARRLVGWGSLTAIEARVTTWWAALQRRRSPADTRLAIPPVDTERRMSTASIRACLETLMASATPLNYRTFLAERG